MVSMKAYYTALMLLGSSCSVLALQNSTTEYPQYIEYQDEFNVTRVIDLQAKPDISVLQKAGAPSDLYLLYTRRNPRTPQRLIFMNESSIRSSNYMPSAETIVIVHGWGGSQDSYINPTVREAVLYEKDVNVIVVDWSRVASANYVTAALGAPGVGRALGNFLAYLNNTAGAQYSQMHLVGFSLGAHVVGNAGEYLGGQVARITGLDPAGPLWGALNVYRLKSGDAMYVEAIHTNERVLGTTLESGDVDFYPNGGFIQPGCSSDSCSHSRSWQLFAATVTYNHLVGRKCSTNLDLLLSCCFGSHMHMGNSDLQKRGNGMYALKTENIYPYRQIN